MHEPTTEATEQLTRYHGL